MRKISGSMHEEPRVIICRNTKNHAPDLFRKALTEASWDHIFSLNDPHDISAKWLDQFTKILDQIAPFKLRKVKNTYAPFIDKDQDRKCSCMIYTNRNIPTTMTRMTGLNISKLEMKLMLK